MKKSHLLIVAIVCLLSSAGKAQFTTLYNFMNTNGGNPGGTLIPSGNLLYATAEEGGAHGWGCIFSFDTNSDAYTDIFDFDGASGETPFYGPLAVSGNLFFGTTVQGGALSSDGCVYSFARNAHADKVLHDFNGPDGIQPLGSVILSGSKLFGMTAAGGTKNYGVIFSIDTTGHNFKILYLFDSIHGKNPESGLTISGSKLYCTTPLGGAGNEGVIFSIDSNGSGFTKLYDFTGLTGANPISEALTLVGNMLYGTADNGGAFNYGCLFSFNTIGNIYTDMHDFDRTDGANPACSLTLLGNTLYGMTTNGGTSNEGVAFSYNITFNLYAKLLDFNFTNGAWPYGTFMVSGSSLYGMATSGGVPSYGVIFNYLPCLVNNHNEPICMATVDTSNNKAEVIWGRTNSPTGTGDYAVYKDSIPGYELTHTQPLGALSEFVDMNSHPSAAPVSYELATVDSCGESALSAPHTTIFLITTAALNVYILNWTPYAGFTPSRYRIFRGPALNAMVQIDSVANTILTYHDTLPPPGSIYLIEAVNPNGTCIPTSKIRTHSISSVNLSVSFSNVSNTTILGIQNIRNTISNLSIYPNPSNGQITISYALSGSGYVRFSLVDELGQVVYDNTKQKNAGHFSEQINLESFPTGIYTLRMQTSGGTSVRKVVIMKK